jgi:hypothetical protein
MYFIHVKEGEIKKKKKKKKQKKEYGGTKF